MPTNNRPMATSNASTRIARYFTLVSLLALVACGSGGGGNNSPGDGSTAPVTISGKITFDRVPFKTAGNGLNLNARVESPARLVVVEAVGTGESILSSTSTDTAGNYSLTVPGSTPVRIRAKAQMQKTGTAPTWDFRVLNNANSDALYAIEGTTADSGTANSTRNLRAESGWNGSSYAAARAAAPFAILDTAYKARELVLSAAADTAFPALDLYWSPSNKQSASFCPDDGDILTSVYFAFSSNDTDDCTPAQPGRSGIYILGDFANGGGDTDEFDQHVIAHEFGHYIEDKFSRSDSIGGNHSIGDRLDLRVAFGEGWGDAFGGMVLNDPDYRDSQSGQSSETGFDMEADESDPNEGPYSEASVTQILWDIFDDGSEPGDTVSLGFSPIFSAMTGAQRTTDAFTSIYSFSSALTAANSSSGSAVEILLTREEIFGDDPFGRNETNFPNKPLGGSAAFLNPYYSTVALNGPAVQVCVTGAFGSFNKLGNERYLVLDLTSDSVVRITAQGVGSGSPTPDPLLRLSRRGSIVNGSVNAGIVDVQETVNEFYDTPLLTRGSYLIEVADYSNFAQELSVRRADTCINVNVTG